MIQLLLILFLNFAYATPIDEIQNLTTTLNQQVKNKSGLLIGSCWSE
ncbi:MAG: hypothetical protein MK008_00410 [Bdellovibrionales bacterium]|nr:hypothetical protein [Bdellovibrionales bacterium]